MTRKHPSVWPILATLARYGNNFMALQVAGLVRLIAGKDAGLRTWDRYKR